MSDSVAFYDENAQEFFDSTVNVDMSELYAEFLPLLPSNGSILDAGCGSGRDTIAFSEKGFDVTAIDASEELVRLVNDVYPIYVQCMSFKEINWIEKFSGIWACASLLHLNDRELKIAFSKLIKALQRSGVMYCSFKYGTTPTKVNSRSFNNKTELTLKELLSDESSINYKRCWVSNDKRPQRSNEKWLNVIITKR